MIVAGVYLRVFIVIAAVVVVAVDFDVGGIVGIFFKQENRSDKSTFHLMSLTTYARMDKNGFTSFLSHWNNLFFFFVICDNSTFPIQFRKLER